MHRHLIVLFLLIATGCHTAMTVPGPTLQAAAQMCRGGDASEPDPRVYRDREGSLRIASKLDEDGVPAGKTIVIDHKTTARWDTGWEPVCYGNDTSQIEALKIRRPDPATTYGAVGAVAAVGLVVSLPFLYIAVCGLHGC